MLIDMKKASQTIRSAFIISIIAGSCSDVFGILLLFEGVISYGSILEVTNLVIITCLLLAPLVLGIVALCVLGKTKPVTKSDRVLRILTKVFSISSIVEGALIIFYLVIVVWFVAALISSL